MDLQIKNKKIAYLGVLTAVALIFSYVEVLIPVDFGIPGMKLGLANIVSVLTIYIFDNKSAYVVSILRVLLAGILFGSFSSMLYSLSGAILSLTVMIFLKNKTKLSIVGESMMGGVFHNIGQLVLACFIVNQLKLTYYGPILIISGFLTGFLIGIVSGLIYKRVETYVRL